MLQEKTEVQQFQYNRYLAYFLIFCVFSSKKIIIYNEELLVALSFVLFLYFSLNYFGNTVQNSLDQTSSSIQFELENYYRLKEESLKQLLFEYKRINKLKTVFGSMENKLSFFVDLNYEVFYNRFSKSVKSKVIAFKALKTLFLNTFQKSILVSTFPQILFNQFHKIDHFANKNYLHSLDEKSNARKSGWRSHQDNNRRKPIDHIADKTKKVIFTTEQSIPKKRGPGRPKGSKNKNGK